MNNEDMRKLVIQYSHRNDLRTDGLIDQMIDLAAIRIGRDTRMIELERRATLTINNFAGLPNGYMSMRGVTIPTPRGPRILRAVSPPQFDAHKADGIEVYCIRNGQLHIHGEAVVSIDYMVRPQKLIEDADSNFVLETFPNLYLYGALLEVWVYAMDAEAFQFVYSKYSEEVDTANALADRQRMGANSTISRVDQG